MHLESAFAHIERDGERMVADLDRLLAIDTSFPPGRNYGALADQVETLLSPCGFVFQRVSVPEQLWHNDALALDGERINLIAAPRNGKPALSIYVHADVVPPGVGWTAPPFAATVRDGRIHGRGAADMKGALASLLASLRAVTAADLPLAYDPVLLLCTDEEGGTYPGVRYLAEQGLVPGHILCLNGGAVPRIWAGCFGSIDLVVRIHGRPGHSGNLDGTVNALEAAVPVMAALVALKRDVESRVSVLPPPPHRAQDGLRSRLNLTVVRAGTKSTAIPGLFELTINRRYAPEERFEDVAAEIAEVVRAAAARPGALKTEILQAGHLVPVYDPTGPHWPRWQRAVSLGFGFPMEQFVRYGAASSSDMGWVQAHGHREILLGGLARPDNNVHGADEWTTIDDLKGLARTLTAYLSAGFAPGLINGEGFEP